MKQIKRLTVAKVKKKLAQMRAERMLWESHWQELADHFLPLQNTVTNQKSEGQKRTWQLLDNSGVISLETLAAALNGFLTNPNEDWFETSFGDGELDNLDELRAWHQQVTALMHAVLKLSNFATAVQEFYPSLLGFGTASVFVDEDPKTFVSFSSMFIKDFYIDEGKDGRINTVYRVLKKKAHELVEIFGEAALPRQVLSCYNTGDVREFCVIHAVYPETVCNPTSKSYKFVSQYIIEELDHEISYGEFMEFPYGVTRWTKAAGEKYGRSPAMTALPEMKVLNKMNETMLIGAQKLVDPPIQMPDDGFILPIITRPSGINYYRAGSNERIEPIFNDTRLDFGYQAMEDRRRRVRESFYIDQLRLPVGGPMMTATEVAERKQEGMIFLGPMFGRIEPEFLRTILQRVYNILARKGVIPEAPAAAAGRAVEVKFIGLIAKSHETNKALSISRMIAAVGPYLQMRPQAADNFDIDQIIRVVAGAYGVPQKVLVKLADLNAAREAAQQQQAQQASMQLQQQQQTQSVDNSLTIAKAAKEAQGIV